MRKKITNKTPSKVIKGNAAIKSTTIYPIAIVYTNKQVSKRQDIVSFVQG